jgi:hypothetical protein
MVVPVSDGGGEVPLEIWGSGDEPSKARLAGGVVYREAGPWSPAVLALLRHLERAGFDGAPRVVEPGLAPDGREMVSFVPGISPHPGPWAPDAVAGVGRLLRGLHDAAASFVLPAGMSWQPWFARSLGGSRPVIGHGDAGPWNIVARDGQPAAFIDFEYAGPVDAVWELAQVTWLNAQLQDDDVAERHGLPNAAGRARRARLIVDGYGLPARDRAGFVDKMIELAVHGARDDAVRFGLTPETRSAVAESGFPVAWAVTWQVRSASWMLTNRAVLERALTASG